MNTVRTSTKRQKIEESIKQKLQNIITEQKNTLDGFNSRLDEAEEQINMLENKAMEL